MITPEQLIEQNRKWSAEIVENDPSFFTELARGQQPNHLWIGCSDSRVPASRILDLPPGELFVHRNIANVVAHSDTNALSVIQFAVEVLQVEHIIICGHYGCGGVQAVLQGPQEGPIDLWLDPVRDVRRTHSESLEVLESSAQIDRLCELNILEQVRNTCTTDIVQRAWEEGQSLTVHGWIYNLEDGRLKDLEISVQSKQQLE